MEEKDEITVINVGWEYAQTKMPARLSVYASRGYILSYMDDKIFILKKSEPREIDYMMIPADIPESERADYERHGWHIICECEKFAAYTAPAGTAFPDAEKIEKALVRRITNRTVLVLNIAALLLVLIMRIHTENSVLSVFRSIFTLIISGVFGFSAMRLISIIRNKK